MPFGRMAETIVLALAGALVALKLKIPVGALLGALITVSVCGVLTGSMYMPSEAKTIAQIVAGIAIGATVNREKVKALKTALLPSVFVFIGMLLSGLLLGMGLHYIFGIDAKTSYYATVAGGMTEMTIISADAGADVATVVLFQLVRVISVILLIPAIAPKIASQTGQTEIQQPSVDKRQKRRATRADVLRIIAVTACCALCGMAGKWSGLSGGTLVCSMAGMIIANIAFGPIPIPKWFKRFAQVLSGAYAGSQVTREVVGKMGSYILPMISVTVGFFGFSLLLTWALRRLFKVDTLTGLFGCAPAGASDMALISLDYGLESTRVALFQTVRLVGIISLAPTLISLITG